MTTVALLPQIIVIVNSPVILFLCPVHRERGWTHTSFPQSAGGCFLLL